MNPIPEFTRSKPTRRPKIHTTDTPDLAPGVPFPQGATWDGKGVNFSLFAEAADEVVLCLFRSPRSSSEYERIRLKQRTTGVWHCYLPDLGPGQLYGYRVYGPYEPDKGLRFNPNKVLLDPYAKAIGRSLKWDDSLFGYTVGHHDEDRSFDQRDSAPFAPLACVVDDRFDWEGDTPIHRPWHETVIYETHVKGFSINHPQVERSIRGTYAGLASKASIDHLVKLGITAVELMPVHHFLQDRNLLERGLSNYWGYNTLNFFTPEPTYASRKTPAGAIREFKEMVKRLHAAGIEVILDVVYNHTAEGNHLGPTLSFRGIDNTAHYRLVEGNERYYMDYTGCGNTLNMVHPHSLRLLMDSLRYWVTDMHIDGFRFDLASALARELHEVDQLGAFFDTIYQDPTLATVKLIAEPWDLGEGGYQVGNFPVGWTEWNGLYRDAVRRFWKGDSGTCGEVATRLAGSADLYEGTRRRPSASINFITAHDGFTLRDLVSYNDKHNDANGEDGRDGCDDNHSWNCGAEGETDDPGIRELRERQQRNMIATLLLSQGVPMISGGDEIGRTQHGNNNGYCQDNEISWHNWQIDPHQQDLLNFTRKVSWIRRDHPNLRRHSFRQEDPLVAPVGSSLEWFRPDGERMQDEDWAQSWVHSMAMYLNGQAPEIRDSNGDHQQDDDFLILLNSSHEGVIFAKPIHLDHPWTIALDTNLACSNHPHPEPHAEFPITLAPRSLVLLRHAR
jgi:isoamylase